MAKKTKTKLGEWQKRASDGGACESCYVFGLLTVDHIVPVSFIDSFDLTGTAKYEDAENFQMLCRPCNTLKAGRFDKRNPKTIPIIKKYIQFHEPHQPNT